MVELPSLLREAAELDSGVAVRLGVYDRCLMEVEALCCGRAAGCV